MEIISNRRLFIDGYFLSQIPLIAGAKMLLQQNINGIWFAIAGLTGIGATAKLLKATVHNLSSLNVICKDENSEDVALCHPGQSAVGIDGFKVNGKVWKLIDGNHAYILPNGKVAYSPFLGLLAQIYVGTEPPLDNRQGWGKLYAAKEEDFL